jgi:MFS family permease
VFWARVLAGAGAMCAVMVAISMVADISAPQNRGRAMIMLQFGNMFGAASAFIVGAGLVGALAQHPLTILPGLAPWRVTHLLFGIVSAALTLLLLFLREPARHEVADAVHTKLGDALGEVWARRSLLAPLFLGQVTVIMADAAAAVWAAPVLARNYGQPAEQIGWIGLVILGSGIVGAILGGVSADLGQKLKLRNGILIGAAVAALLSIPGAFYPVMPSLQGFGWMLALLLTCGAITGLVTAAAIAVLVPNEIRGVCIGLFMVIGSIIGLGIAPTLVTVISDNIGGPRFINYGLAATGAITSAIAAVGFISALRARAE